MEMIMMMPLIITIPCISIVLSSMQSSFNFIISSHHHNPGKSVRFVLVLPFYTKAKSWVSKLMCLRTSLQERENQCSNPCFRILSPRMFCFSGIQSDEIVNQKDTSLPGSIGNYIITKVLGKHNGENNVDRPIKWE